jgi:hypothetical protein
VTRRNLRPPLMRIEVRCFSLRVTVRVTPVTQRVMLSPSRDGRPLRHAFGRFDLAYFRHTERWFTVYRGLTAAECFEEIEGNEVFWPM